MQHQIPDGNPHIIAKRLLSGAVSSPNTELQYKLSRIHDGLGTLQRVMEILESGNEVYPAGVTAWFTFLEMGGNQEAEKYYFIVLGYIRKRLLKRLIMIQSSDTLASSYRALANALVLPDRNEIDDSYVEAIGALDLYAN